MKSALPSDLIAPKHAMAYLAGILLAAALLCLGVTALPHDPYIRYQQFAAGDVSRLRWVYERIHFDKTSIDVAVIGSSRVEAAISAPYLEQALSKRLGRAVHVANLAVPLEGRNLHYAVAQELLAAHPETRLVILSLVEPIRRSHPTFRNIANTADILGSPMLINYYWLDDASFLPYRQLNLFLQTRFPSWFGVHREFEPASYRGTGFDTTLSFRLENGKLVDREALHPQALLDREVLKRSDGRSLLSRVTGGNDNIIEDSFTTSLAHQLSARCTALVFMRLPTWRGSMAKIDTAASGQLAPILVTPPSIGSDWWDYSDPGHLRRAGIDKVSEWLPGALQPYLGALDNVKSCSN